MKTLSLRFILGFLLLATPIARAANSNLNFTRLPDFATSPSGAYGTVLADLNHDNKPDLVRLAAFGGNEYRLSVQLGNGRGSFGAPAHYPIPFYFPFLHVADLNNDGHPDVLTVLNDKTLRVYLGNADGTLQNPVSTPGTLAPNAIALTDFNQDGKLDLIMCGYPASPLQGYVTTMTGNGNGTFGNANTFTTSTRLETTGSAGVAAGDFNSDGWVDFVVSNPGGPFTISTFINNQNGTFNRMREVAVAGLPGLLNTADVNNDGKPDLIYTLCSDPFYGQGPRGKDIGVAFGNGNGTFGQIVENGTLVPNMESPIYSVASTTNFFLKLNSNVVAADMDGDGDQDLVAAAKDRDSSQSIAAILRNHGGGVFTPARQLPANHLSHWVSVGQLEGDGSLDMLVTANDSVNQTYISGAVPPTITSAASATFQIQQNNSFTVTGTGVPAPSFSVSGALPSGVSFSASGVLSGTPALGSAGTYPLLITASNSIPPEATQNFTLTVTTGLPVVVNPSANTITASSAHLGADVASDSGASITRRGVVYAPTSVNSNPKLGGNSVIVNDDPGQTGNFFRTVTGLSASTGYSFAAFAQNSRGVAYSSVVTFQTLPPPGAGSLIVTTLTDEDNGSSDPGLGAGTSLREAVAYANALGGNQTITFLPNLYANGPATITLTLGTIDLANLTGITTIAGPGASQLTIHGNGSSRLFRMDEGGARFNAMTLAGGRWAGAGDGAAIRSFGTLYVNDCVFTNNVSNSNGGAIYNGGGGYIARSTFVNNSAAMRGGAIASEGTTWVMNCTFSGNSASEGGAMGNVFGSSWIHAICSTIANNAASTAGGGLFVNNPSRTTVHNTIISGNNAPAGANTSAAASSQSSSLIDGDPAAIFTTGTLVNNGGSTPTIALKPGGLAVNAGTNSLAVDNTFAPLTTDQRGKPRVIGTAVDIGAYEAPLLPTLGGSSVTNVSATSAILGGNVTDDGFGIISKRGIVYALTSQNPTPTIGGEGVIEVDASGTTGAFTVPVGGLSALTSYSFTSFATNETGTVYAPVQTFQTTELPSLTVTIVSDTANSYDAQSSLREALVYAQSLGGAQTVTFSPALAGQTITLSNAWSNEDSYRSSSALTIDGDITIQGPASAPGIILKVADAAQLRHFVVAAAGKLTLTNLTLTGGKATLPNFSYGGSIWNFGSVTVRNCTFTGNSATNEGGAIHSWGGSTSLHLDNSTFSGNSATNQGSAIVTGAAQTVFRYLTVTNNTCPNGPLWIYQAPVTMLNSIIAGNSNDAVQTWGGDGSATFTAQSTNNILGATSAAGLTNGTNGNQLGVSAAALNLGALADNGGTTRTVALQAGSLALDAGVAVIDLTTDQRSIVRPQGGAADVGAFEARVAPVPAFTVNNVDTTISAPAFNLLSASGATPTGGTFTGAGVNGTEFNPVAAGAGIHTITYAVTSEDGIPSSATFTVTVAAPPSVTSANSATFTVGSAGTFAVTALGYPAPTLSLSGSLPTGVTFNAGTGELSGTPAPGTGGTYALTITAANGVGSAAMQTFTLAVNEAPAITSASSTTFAVGTAGSFTVMKTGYPAPTVTHSGALPNGVTFDAATGVLSGTPQAGTGGAYPISFTASNGVGNSAVQSFTLRVNQAPAFTSANNATSTVGTNGSFTVATTGFPAPALTLSGPALPFNLAFIDNGDGTGTISGTPAAGAGGVYQLTVVANNGVSASQNFTLTVNEAPNITSANSARVTEGNALSFAVQTTGFPAPTIAQSGALPTGVTFTGGMLRGIPAEGTAGTYPITFTAGNGIGTDHVQSFTLTVDGPVCTAMPANLVAWFPGEGNGVEVKDGRNGTVLGGAAFAAGKAGQAFTFNGSTSVIEVPDDAAWDLGANDFTVETWVRFNAVSGSDVLVAHSESAALNQWIFWLKNGKLEFHLDGSAVASIASDAAFAPVLGQWHHVAVTRSGNIYRFYVDGVRNGTDRFDGNSVPNANAPLTLGRANAIPALNGMLDEVQIFSRALSAAEIASVYSSSSEGLCVDAFEASSALSRKTHGSAGVFDIPLPLTGAPAVECRTGDHTIVVEFSNVLAEGSVSVNAGAISGAPAFEGRRMTVVLTSVPNTQTMTLTLADVKDGFGQTLPNVTVPMHVLVGDVTGNQQVNASDVGYVKAQSSASTLDASNFRADVNVNGSINASDISVAKAASGTFIP